MKHFSCSWVNKSSMRRRSGTIKSERGAALVLMAISLLMLFTLLSLLLFTHWYSYHKLIERQHVDLAAVSAVNEADKNLITAQEISQIAEALVQDNFRLRAKGSWSSAPAISVTTSPGTGTSVAVDTVDVRLRHEGVDALFAYAPHPHNFTVDVRGRATNLQMVVMLVLDVSQSMEGQVPCVLGGPWQNRGIDPSTQLPRCWKIDEALSAIRNFVLDSTLLPDGAYIGLSRFSGNAALVVPLTRIVDSTTRASIVAAMQSASVYNGPLHPNGTTNIARAFEVSVGHYLENKPPSRHIPALVLLSDGGPNNPLAYEVGQQYYDPPPNGPIRTRYELLHNAAPALRQCILSSSNEDFPELASLFYADYYVRQSGMVLFSLGYGTPIPPNPGDPFNYLSSYPPGNHDWQFVNFLNRIAGDNSNPVDFPCVSSFEAMTGTRGRGYTSASSSGIDLAFREIVRLLRAVLVP